VEGGGGPGVAAEVGLDDAQKIAKSRLKKANPERIWELAFPDEGADPRTMIRATADCRPSPVRPKCPAEQLEAAARLIFALYRLATGFRWTVWPAECAPVSSTTACGLVRY